MTEVYVIKKRPSGQSNQEPLIRCGFTILFVNVVFHIYLHFGGFDAQIVALIGVAVGQQFFSLARKQHVNRILYNILI
jgi:hypothetical protein